MCWIPKSNMLLLSYMWAMGMEWKWEWNHVLKIVSFNFSFLLILWFCVCLCSSLFLRFISFNVVLLLFDLQWITNEYDEKPIVHSQFVLVCEMITIGIAIRNHFAFSFGIYISISGSWLWQTFDCKTPLFQFRLECKEYAHFNDRSKWLESRF